MLKKKCDAMLAFLLEHDFINKQQHGFISKRSTCSQLLECINDLSVSLSHKQCVDVADIDFRRAFGSVVYSKLYLKLNSLGISGNLLHWICDTSLSSVLRQSSTLFEAAFPKEASWDQFYFLSS